MTIEEKLARKIIKNKQKIDALRKEMTALDKEMKELGNSLAGMKLNYQGRCAYIEYIDGNANDVSLYIENDKGIGNSFHISVLELAELLAAQ